MGFLDRETAAREITLERQLKYRGEVGGAVADGGVAANGVGRKFVEEFPVRKVGRVEAVGASSGSFDCV